MKTISKVLLACWIVVSAAAPVAARQNDPEAIHNRIKELLDARDYSAALAEAQKLEAIVKARYGADSRWYAVVLGDIGLVKQSQGRYAEAEEFYRRGLAIQQKAVGPLHPDVADFLLNLANAYDSQGKYGEAAALHQRALAIREKTLGPSHPDVAASLNNLANVYHSQGNDDLAILSRARLEFCCCSFINKFISN